MSFAVSQTVVSPFVLSSWGVYALGCSRTPTTMSSLSLPLSSNLAPDLASDLGPDLPPTCR